MGDYRVRDLQELASQASVPAPFGEFVRRPGVLIAALCTPASLSLFR